MPKRGRINYGNDDEEHGSPSSLSPRSASFSRRKFTIVVVQCRGKVTDFRVQLTDCRRPPSVRWVHGEGGDPPKGEGKKVERESERANERGIGLFQEDKGGRHRGTLGRVRRRGKWKEKRYGWIGGDRRKRVMVAEMGIIVEMGEEEMRR